ncbi:MAG: hypothetical protein COA96_16715 [SAR86 cluster bacterium]|uniref:Uncharacterized protein n=1 Tax=SAR86 cluster bacterium TaxID=2030880 RepID=A0A2A5AG05_9GAMM|nr:MAG: hypothetical protein COA96_16715 [SAR86 cluster bacterium]
MPGLNVPDWIVKFSVMSIFALQIWLVQQVYSLDKKVDMNIANLDARMIVVDTLERQVPSNSRTLASHTEQLASTTGQLFKYTNEQNATRRELRSDIIDATAGRFTLSDWNRERKNIELKFQLYKSQVVQLQNQLGNRHQDR